MGRFRRRDSSVGSADMRIGLLATLRDESQICPFFRVVEKLEEDPRVERLFCSFYENDSSDDTPGCLAWWLRDRPGSCRANGWMLPACAAVRSIPHDADG